jgi:hypothetical protein
VDPPIRPGRLPEDTLDVFVGLSSLIFVVLGTAVGVRILVRARRSRSLPELAVGGALVSFAGVTQTFSIARVALEAQMSASLSITLQLGATLGSALSLLGLYVFTWRVFRPDSRWAALLFAGGSALGLWAGAAMAAISYYAVGVPPVLTGRWIALSATSYAICFGWAAVESLLYHHRLRLRLRLGLADPLLVNRFLLWGGACCFGFAIDVVLIAQAASGVDFNHAPLPRLLVSASGLVNAIAWFLGFTPPAWYARWTRGGADAPPAELEA